MTETQTTNPVTPKQAAFIVKLLDEREGYTEGFAERVKTGIATFVMTRKEASDIITWLLERPKRPGVKTAWSGGGGGGGKTASWPKVTAGLYFVGDEPWLARKAKGGDHCYAMRLASAPQPDTKLNWEFVKGGMAIIAKEGRPATAEEAAALGHQTHHCCFCGIELTDDGPNRSVEVGYGPICAGNNGLPWG